MTPEELLLRSLRHQFYSRIRESAINGIIWGAEKDNYGNHMDFRINEICGHVNWYYRNCERVKYGGNVCVVFKQYPNDSQIPNGFRGHPNHMNWIIASSEFNNVSDAVDWAIKSIHEIINRH